MHASKFIESGGTGKLGMLHSGATSQQATIQSYSLVPGSGKNTTLTVTVQDSGDHRHHKHQHHINEQRYNHNL
jgi:hypothetical protein